MLLVVLLFELPIQVGLEVLALQVMCYGKIRSRFQEENKMETQRHQQKRRRECTYIEAVSRSLLERVNYTLCKPYDFRFVRRNSIHWQLQEYIDDDTNAMFRQKRHR